MPSAVLNKLNTRRCHEPLCEPPVSFVFLESPFVFAFPLTCCIPGLAAGMLLFPFFFLLLLFSNDIQNDLWVVKINNAIKLANYSIRLSQNVSRFYCSSFSSVRCIVSSFVFTNFYAERIILWYQLPAKRREFVSYRRRWENFILL